MSDMATAKRLRNTKKVSQQAKNTQEERGEVDSANNSAILENAGLSTIEFALATPPDDLRLHINGLCRALDIRLSREELDKAAKTIVSGGAVADGFRAVIESGLRQAAGGQVRSVPGPSGTAIKKPREKKLELPPLPKGLQWPTDTYSEAHKKYGWDIVRYLDERWLPLLQSGVATRRILVMRDTSAINAIYDYIKPDKRTGKRREWPERLHFPTLKEENDRKLSEEFSVIANNPHLAQLVITRQRKNIRAPESP